MTGVRLPATALVATFLATFCLGAAFVTGAWFPPTAVAVLAAVLGCEGARRLSLPRPLVPVTGLAALLVALIALFAHEQAVFGFLPDSDSLRRLWDIAGEGRVDLNRYAAPVDALPGLRLLTSGGIGLVALAVDTFAVTLRRPALAGLPLLALYSVPAVVVPDGVSWVAFAIGAAGYLALLLVEAHEKVSRWGRPLRSGGFGTRIGTAPLTAVGRRVGFAAIACAVAVPVVVPGLEDGVLGNGNGGFNGKGRGNRTVAVINPILNLKDDLVRPDNREVLRYTTNDPDPGYIRLVAEDDFDGQKWEPRRLQVPQSQSVDRGLALPSGMGDAVKRSPVETSMTIGELDTRWLPLPYPASRVDIEGIWLYDKTTFNVFSTSSSTRAQSYRIQHLDVAPRAEELREAPSPPQEIRDRFLALPAELDSTKIAATAQRVTRRARTPYDQALALQTWLREKGGFTYDTQAPDGMGVDAISAFLETKRGFCVQFASTMAVMARELDIPARVAVGFLPGRSAGQGTYSVTLHDLHAWPELYFEGVGWVLFEPTPASRTGQAPAWARPEATGLAGGAPRDGSTADDEEGADSADAAAARRSPRGLEDPAVAGRPAEVALPGATEPTEAQVPWELLAGVTLALLLAATPAVARMQVRRRRWRRAARAGTASAVAEAAWTELRDSCIDVGRAWHESETPRHLSRRLGASLGADDLPREALNRIAHAAERARYAASPAAPSDLRRDVATVRAALLASAGRLVRIRARVVPPSTRALVHVGAERFADSLDLLDRAAARARRRKLPRGGTI